MEFVGLQPDIILTSTTVATAAVQRETRTIPILFGKTKAATGPEAVALSYLSQGLPGFRATFSRRSFKGLTRAANPDPVLVATVRSDNRPKPRPRLSIMSPGSARPATMLKEYLRLRGKPSDFVDHAASPRRRLPASRKSASDSLLGAGGFGFSVAGSSTTWACGTVACRASCFTDSASLLFATASSSAVTVPVGLPSRPTRHAPAAKARR